MLTVGVDSYVSLEEAEKIAHEQHISTDKALVVWDSLSDSDKEVLLRTSCKSIDNLKFNGRRRNYSQVLEFPRDSNYPSGIGFRLYISHFIDNGLYSGAGGSDGGLSQVKIAQVINAVMGSLYNNLVVDTVGIKIQGLTSKRAGPIAESYNISSNGRGSASSSSDSALTGIYSNKVYSLLNPWLSGSYYNY